MTTFYLVRHGLRVSRNEDTLLSEVGVAQAQQTGRYLQSKNLSQIFVSPLSRTMQTATIINQYLKLPLSTDDRLKERMESVPGKVSFADFLVEWDKTTAQREYQPPYGNSAIHAGDRIKAVLDELIAEQNYLLVSHAGVIGDLVRNLFEQEGTLRLKMDPQKKLQWLEIAECSVTVLQRENGLYVLQRVNDISHLGLFTDK